MKTRTITEYDEVDVLERALTITDTDTDCLGGEHCPNCRIAIAVTRLTDECDLHFYYGDGMIQLLKAKEPRDSAWSKEEGDQYLHDQLKKYQELLATNTR